MNWRLFRRKLHLAFLLGISLFAVLYWLKIHNSRPAKPIPMLGTVPEFALTERSGQPLTLADLRGRIWIADFIFTHCAGPCPLMTAQMARLQRSLATANDVRLVSFTVDPERDTPPVLAAYAKEFGADPQKWFFATGPKKAIRELANKGFRLSAIDNTGPDRQPDEDTILHSTHFVLVDRAANIRGYYDGLETNGVAQLLKDVNALLAGR